MSQKYDCIIIGLGIAGTTAAIYLKRSNMNILVIEKSAPGGQINRTSKIENYPGFKEIDGPSLAINMYEQLTSLGVNIKFDEVKNIKENDGDYIVELNNETIETKGIIIATGRRQKELGLENEKKLIGRGISWCAICDGTFYKNKEVAVIGGGNSALEDAIYLSKICSKVTIVSKYDEFKADKILIKQLKKLENIEYKMKSLTTKIISEDNKLKSIEINNESIIEVEGMFIHIGHVPNSEIFDFLKLENGYIVVDNNLKTSKEKIYACGDIIKKDLYQIVTAASEGAIAAINFKKTISEEGL